LVIQLRLGAINLEMSAKSVFGIVLREYVQDSERLARSSYGYLCNKYDPRVSGPFIHRWNAFLTGHAHAEAMAKVDEEKATKFLGELVAEFVVFEADLLKITGPAPTGGRGYGGNKGGNGRGYGGNKGGNGRGYGGNKGGNFFKQHPASGWDEGVSEEVSAAAAEIAKMELSVEGGDKEAVVSDEVEKAVVSDEMAKAVAEAVAKEMAKLREAE
jgi:hypothetical protein